MKYGRRTNHIVIKAQQQEKRKPAMPALASDFISHQLNQPAVHLLANRAC
jgi:hypothetical protein